MHKAGLSACNTTDYYILCHITKLVDEGFYSDGGRIWGVPVTIVGSSYALSTNGNYRKKTLKPF